jgi:hypothetical protein
MARQKYSVRVMMLLLASLCLFWASSSALENGIQPTPPMGVVVNCVSYATAQLIRCVKMLVEIFPQRERGRTSVGRIKLVLFDQPFLWNGFFDSKF